MEKELETITFKGAPMATKGNEISIMRMPLNKIKLGKNSRANIDQDELEGLMESIKEIGLLQPIGVTKNGVGYVVAYGNRRFLACSKLGLSHIPVIVHTDDRAGSIDIKNLAENVQRKNIGLTEVGRYVSLLEGEGLSVSEMAVRLGVSKGYVNSCKDAFLRVPQEFRKDIVSVTTKSKKKPGKIAANAMTRILNASRTYHLSAEQEKELFAAARGDNFETHMISKYAMSVKAGHRDFMSQVEPLKHIKLSFAITQKEHDRLHRKHVEDGPFRSVSALMRAILSGKKSETVKIADEKTGE